MNVRVKHNFITNYQVKRKVPVHSEIIHKDFKLSESFLATWGKKS